MPKLKELYGKHKDQGLVLIGVHSTNGGEKMAAFVQGQGIDYPVAIDRGGATVKKYFVDGYPDYHVIDRSGNVRVADLSNGEVERVIKALLAEPAPATAPATVPAALAKASTKATRKDKRILAMIGESAARKTLRESWSKDRVMGKFVSNEFEVVGFTAGDEAALAKTAGAAVGTLRLAFYDASGVFLAAANAPDDLDGLKDLLQNHRIPEKVASDLMAAALSQATAQKKRVLVHLGAPW